MDALRRLAANVVDVVGPDGTFYRALRDGKGTTLIAVRPHDARTIEVRATGRDPERWLPLLARMLGTAADLREWEAGSARIAWLRRLAVALRGLKPPRYASAWEACAHAIVFQQISIHAAASIMRRAIERLGDCVTDGNIRCFSFPAAQRWLEADESALRAAGLSGNKVAHLRSAASAFAGGSVDPAVLEGLPTEQAAEHLCRIRGIGPWSAAVVMLRGFGRLDVFPLRDSGVARSVATLAGKDVNVDAVLRELRPVRGMLYYHLLLGRLHAAAAAGEK